MADPGDTSGDDCAHILAEAVEVAAQQVGGTLGTIHAERGTPCVTFVFFHLDPQGRVLFGSNTKAQHSRNLEANPAVSFLIDNRRALPAQWDAFDRIAIEGVVHLVPPGSPGYETLLDSLRQKNALAARFTEGGHLFCLQPAQLTLHRGARSQPRVVEFPAPNA